jgi:hypothetical protein
MERRFHLHISVPWVLGSEAAAGSGVVTRGKGDTILGWPGQGWGYQMGQGCLEIILGAPAPRIAVRTSAAVRQ